ncbi:MAG TPA: hypothetical protein DGG95_07250 [Cytophagales bacterium]|jgi:hypothetical protein|nr:hypothetical protein [Cytophagales bacterium]
MYTVVYTTIHSDEKLYGRFDTSASALCLAELLKQVKDVLTIKVLDAQAKVMLEWEWVAPF